MMNTVRTALLHAVLAGGILAGCASKSPAPVIDRGAAAGKTAAPTATAARPGEFHTVKRGETLYSIALEHGQSYRDVAAWNNIDNPNMIRVGQQLRVAPPEGTTVVRPVQGPAPVETRPLGPSAASNTDSVKREPKGGKQPYTEQALAAAQKQGEASSPAPVPAKAETRQADAVAGGELAWAWPSAGKVIAGYVEGGNKGVDIDGRIGEPVLAAEAGKVTYAGSGIRGYGNLLIVQHANSLSSVYAHNSRLLAKEGQQVEKGQKIAELGNSDADQPKLHFEIRRQGKPLDPLKLLPSR